MISKARAFQKVQPALAFAASHLDQDLSLETLARQTGWSPFHLHRVFAATTGESPKELTQRLRLERAAALLLTRSDSVLEVALECGFRSHEVFARAFRHRFGLTPSGYRQRGFAHPVSAKQAARHAALIAHVGHCIGLFHINENKRSEMSYSVTKKELSQQPVLAMERRIQRTEIAKTLGEIYGRTHFFAQQNGIALAGPPFARYLEWGPGMITLQAGMPVAAAVPGDDEIKGDILPGGPAAFTVHSGHYDKLPDAYAAIQQWMDAQELQPGGAPWESYVTDPGDYPDPKDWRTEVYWPLA